MSSLTGGFDFVAQISADEILKIIQSKWGSLNSSLAKSITTPFTLQILDPKSPAHINISDLHLQIQDGNSFTLLGTIVNSELPSVSLTGLNGLTFVNKGSLSIMLPLVLTDTTTPQKQPAKQLTVDFSKVSVGLDYGPDPKGAKPNDLFRIGIELQLASLKTVNLPVKVPVVPGQGNLAALQFSSFEVHTRADWNALLLFGSAGNTPGANWQTMSGSLLIGGANVAVAISASAFQSQLLCPMIAKQFGIPVSGMPTVCGQGAPVIKGFTITKLAFTFNDGGIAIDGSFNQNTSEYKVIGSVHGNLTLTPAGSAVKPDVDWKKPKVAAYPKGLLAIASALLPGTFLVLDGIAELVVIAVGAIVGQNALQDATSGLSPLNLGSFFAGGSITVIQSKIQPDGVLIAGTLAVQPGLKLKTDFQLVPKETVTNEEPGTPIPMVAYLPLAFHYTDTLYKCDTVAVVSISTNNIPFPLSNVHWSFSLDDGEVPITQSGPMTLPMYVGKFNSLGQPMMVKTIVTLQVELTDVNLTLRNKPDDGNYGFFVNVRVVDQAGMQHSTGTGVSMTGAELDEPLDYINAYNAFKKKLDDEGKDLVGPPKLPGDPGPQEIQQYLEGLLSNPSPQTAQLLQGLATAYPGSLRQSAAGRVALLRQTAARTGLRFNVPALGRQVITDPIAFHVTPRI